MVTNNELLKQIQDLAKKVATQESLDELKQIINEQNKTISTLQDKVIALESEVATLRKKSESSEQYSRRNCLRIGGVPSSPNETADDCVKLVANLLQQADLSIPEAVLDRAHRVGIAKGTKPRQIIVKFSTWRHRSALYRARKEIRQKLGYTIQPDLTKTRLDLLNQVKALCETSNVAVYAFADINCALGIKLKTGGVKFFDTIDGAYKILGLQTGYDEAIPE